jgi:LysM repeat protein/predicted esterase
MLGQLLMWRFTALVSLALVALALPARASETHVVADGQTLGKIADRYGITITALCEANSIRRRDRIRPGQTLVIPDPSDKDGSQARLAAESSGTTRSDERDEESDDTGKDEPTLPGGMRQLDGNGSAPAFYFTPTGRGRRSMRPVIVYLHGRGGHPDQDCLHWASVARRLGWLICPSGPVPYGDGRAWDNNWSLAHSATMTAIQGLRKKYGRRVQLYGNTLVGFSEGAFAAMNVGVREPHVFNRWLILAAASQYWGGPGVDALKTARERVRRVFLITGENDGVVDSTHQVEEWLEQAGVTTRVATPEDMGHELALARKPELYRRALAWLDRGDLGKPKSRRDERLARK